MVRAIAARSKCDVYARSEKPEANVKAVSSTTERLDPLALFQLENAANSRSETMDIFAPNSAPVELIKTRPTNTFTIAHYYECEHATDLRRIFPVAEQEKTQKAIYSVRVAHRHTAKEAPERGADAATTHTLLMKTHCAFITFAHTSCSRSLLHSHF